MSSALFPGRFDQLRSALGDGPTGSVNELAHRAEVSVTVVRAGYASEIGEELRLRISDAAADMLSVDRDAMRAWLVEGHKVPDVASYIAWLPTQVACNACKAWFSRGDDENYVARWRKCRACVRALQNPNAAVYEVALQEKLPEIRAVHPPLARAVEQTLAQREAPTYARLARRCGEAVAVIAAILKGMGLDKRAIELLLVAGLTIPADLAGRGGTEVPFCGPPLRRRRVKAKQGGGNSDGGGLRGLASIGNYNSGYGYSYGGGAEAWS